MPLTPRSRRIARGAVACLAVLGPVLAIAGLATVASAHGGGSPSLLVPLDHVVPGQSFEVQADDFEAAVNLRMSVTRDATTLDLGDAVTDADGHATVVGVLPGSYPFGYAEVTAAGDDGSRAGTWIRVGDSTYVSPVDASRGGVKLGPEVWLLAGAAIAITVLGGLAFVAARRNRSPKI